MENDYILDSSLILATNKLYNTKIITCGDYIQVYFLDNLKMKKQEKCLSDKEIKEYLNNKKNNIVKIDTDNLYKKDFDKPNTIDKKNIIRSKLQCQRLAKANAKEWKTFITLTISENITDIDVANKLFKNFVDSVRRKKRDFKYIAVPEFQKRGAAHYHVLTNVSINDDNLIYEQEDRPEFKHIKHWSYGYNKVDIVENDIKKIVGYISKYMTKDIDNRLFNHKRYLFSKNLIYPKTSFLNLNNEKDFLYLKKILQNKSSIYKNIYSNSFNGQEIEFEEYL